MAGTEAQCPACGQPTHLPPWPQAPSPFRPLRPLGDYIKTGWEIFKQYPGGFIVFSLINVAIHLALRGVPLLGWLASVVVSTALIMGNFIVSAKLLQRQSPGWRDFFAGFNFFLPLLVVSLVASVFISLGMLLLIIPGLYLAVGYLFASCLVIDRRLDFWSAMELSRRTVNPLWFSFFAFMLLLVVVNLAGALLMGVGLLVTIPLTFGAMTAAFADLFGFQSDYTQEAPRLKTL